MAQRTPRRPKPNKNEQQFYVTDRIPDTTPETISNAVLTVNEYCARAGLGADEEAELANMLGLRAPAGEEEV